MCLILQFNHLSIGDSEHDFANQHVKFIEYIRNLILSTHDLKPQISMNYGLGQSFVALYYHGMYNPFILASLLLGALPIKYVMYFIYALIIGSTSVSMHLLCRLNNFSHKQSRLLSIFMAFSGTILFHLAFHPMFIYYLPFMNMSLVSLHYMAVSKNKYLYSLMFTLVFFTNFFFAPIVSIIQFAYFIGLLVEKNKPILEGFINFTKAYILGLLMGLIMLVPIYIFAQEGIRGTNPNISYNLFQTYDKVVTNLINPYNLGIGAISIIAIIYGVLFVKEKQLKFPVFILIIIMFFTKVVLLLNLDMYINYKHIIYFLPILWLIFGKMIFNEDNKYRVLFVLLLSVVAIVIVSTDKLNLHIVHLLFAEIIAVFLMYQFRNKRFIINALTCWIISITMINSLIVVDSDKYKQATLSVQNEVVPTDLSGIKAISPYRTGEGDLNRLSSMDSFNPNLYTSLENPNFQEFLRSSLELELSNSQRVNSDSIFNNYLLRKYLGITKFTDSKGKTTNQKALPIVYGVGNDAVYDLDSLLSLDPHSRILALNEGTFVEDEAKDMVVKTKPKLIYTSKEKLTIKDHKFNKEYTLPKEYQKDGTLVVTFDTDIADDSQISDKITINGHTNTVMMNDFYGENQNRRASFLLDTNQDTNKLKLKVSKGKYSKGTEPITYSNLKVYYVDHQDVDNNQFTYYAPQNFKVDMSHYYEFTVNQKENGYLATTIPYDNGFTIFVDGKESDISKINGLFLGTKLSAGTHKIRIEYNIPGYKVSLIISSLAFTIFIIYQSKLLIKKKQ